MALFTVENLSFTYPGQTAPAIDRLTLTVPEGAFLVLCGPSGCGKSTLLRQLKPALAPHGVRQGRILFRDAPLEQVDQRTQAARIGFVQQSPENQIVTDKVWHELAFGLESLGTDTPTIRRRVAEMAAFFGIEDWFYRDVAELSGGQKQLLNLASVMAMQPDVLILDEPTSQLDPIAASDFLAVLGKINRELGTAVVLTEHRLEEAFPLATAVAVMDRGRLLCTGTPYDVGRRLKTLGHRMFLAMPAAMRVWASVETEAPCPVTVREGRDFLRRYAAERPLGPLPWEEEYPRREPVITARGVWFRYEPDSPDVVKGLDLTLGRGEFLALLGGNGAGKSTTLRLLSGMKKPQRGEISVKGTLGMLPQNPQTLFVKKTVREDLFEIFSGTKTPRPQQEERVARMVALCRLEDLLDRHPYDLSGGEQQRAALAKVLLLEPEILLLDEPTKGLDAEFKQTFALILRTLLRQGVSLLMVSHDVEFCARYAHRCALFFDGGVVTEAAPRDFFSGNSFYTTAANRMARSLEPRAVTPEDVMAACGGTVPAEPALPEDIPPLPEAREETPDWKPPRLPLWRKALAAVSGAGALAIFLYAANVTDLSAVVDKGGLTALGQKQLALYLVFCGLLLILALAIGRVLPEQPAIRPGVDAGAAGVHGPVFPGVRGAAAPGPGAGGHRGAVRHLRGGPGGIFHAAPVQARHGHDHHLRRSAGGRERFSGGGLVHAGVQYAVFSGGVDPLADVLHGDHRLSGGGPVPEGPAAADPGEPVHLRRVLRHRDLRRHHEPGVGADVGRGGGPDLENPADLLRHRLPGGLRPRRGHGVLPVDRRGAYAGEAGPDQGKIRPAAVRAAGVRAAGGLQFPEKCGILIYQPKERRSAMEKRGIKIAAQNRKAHHDYFVEDRYEAGIELAGTEVKSIRQGRVNLKDSYCVAKDGEIYAHSMHISPYEQGNIFNKDPDRPKRLLMHKREIRKLHDLQKQDGYALIPLSLYFKDSRVKVELGLCKGKKTYDKRDAIAKRDAKREMERAVREKNR